MKIVIKGVFQVKMEKNKVTSFKKSEYKSQK